MGGGSDDGGGANPLSAVQDKIAALTEIYQIAMSRSLDKINARNKKIKLLASII